MVPESWFAPRRAAQTRPATQPKPTTRESSSILLSRHAVGPVLLLLVNLSFFHHKFHVFEMPDVFERIARDRDNVGILPRLQGAEEIGLTEEIGGIAGGGLNGLHRCHAVLHHERKLAGVDAMWANARVRAERHLHASANGLRKIAALDLTQVLVVLQKIGRRFIFLG